TRLIPFSSPSRCLKERTRDAAPSRIPPLNPELRRLLPAKQVISSTSFILLLAIHHAGRRRPLAPACIRSMGSRFPLLGNCDVELLCDSVEKGVEIGPNQADCGNTSDGDQGHEQTFLSEADALF